MNYTLGLDMGVASLGWAVISQKDNFIDSGVRIFPAGIDKFGTGKDTHLNQQRRKARGARRRVTRKAQRKILIRKILTELNWVPSESEPLQNWEQLDVYELRHHALREKITLQEFARIILHLNQRRGFLSLRKSEVDAAEGEDKKKLEGMLGEMNTLQEEINATFSDASDRTLGNYLHHLRNLEGGEHGNHIRLRARHIRRDMLHHEFSLIWAEQRPSCNNLASKTSPSFNGVSTGPPAPLGNVNSRKTSYALPLLTVASKNTACSLSSTTCV